MHRTAIALLISLTGVSALAARSSQAPLDSWGKAGVSFDQYRADAVECGRSGYYLDVSNTDAAKELATASRQLDAINRGVGVDPTDEAILYANQQQRIIHSVNPDKQFKDVKELLQATVDQCLKGRGYSKFQLTPVQQQALRRLKIGSEERHIYLYRLASDPSVLASQADKASNLVP